MKFITINVDDLGLSDAVNQAVLELAELKRIHSTSFMSLGQVSSDEVRTLQQLNIEIGLHFDLTEFVDQGSLNQVLFRSYMRVWSVAKLDRLICQQLDAFEDKIGTLPVFIDGHQHVHQFPQIRDCLIKQIEKRYPQPILFRNTQTIQQDMKAKLIYFLGGYHLKRNLQKKGWLYNSSFGGVYHFNPSHQLLSKLWESWLDQAESRGTVLMCHPAIEMSNWSDVIKSAREQEWNWLKSDEFFTLWKKYDCRPQSWQDLKKIALTY